jgi:hypothetical protein
MFPLVYLPSFSGHPHVPNVHILERDEQTWKQADPQSAVDFDLHP